jgi:hypothetical protein
MRDNIDWKTMAIALLVVALALAGCNGDEGAPENGPTATAETPREPTVSVAPEAVPVGGAVRVTAVGFPPTAQVQVGVGPAGGTFEVVATEETDDGGTIEALLTVPEYVEAGAEWEATVATPDDAFAATSPPFTLVEGEEEDGDEAREPAVTISPNSGPPGTSVEVVATGFPPETEVQAGVGRENTEFADSVTATTDATGRLEVELTVPESAEIDMPWVAVVHVLERGGVRATSEVFEVTAERGEPVVTITPESGPPGTEVRVEARGFPANTEVQVGAGREGTEFTTSKRVDTNDEGAVDTTITIPETAEPGEPWGVVVRIVALGGARPSATFQVTAPPEGGGFTDVEVALIAVDDGGPVGCGDSVVPVEVQVEPTRAPLRAALNALLAIDEEYYGQSGLYNALHNSDLTVGSINIVNAQAIIYLNGDLSLAGVCDDPRVEAQLRRTALQFSTVNAVTIYLNGEPLEDVLGGRE